MDGRLLSLIFVAILVLYAVVHATEIALGSLNVKRLEYMKSEGKKGVKTLKKLYAVSDRYTAAVRQLLVLLAFTLSAVVMKSDFGQAFVDNFADRNLGWLGYI